MPTSSPPHALECLDPHTQHSPLSQLYSSALAEARDAMHVYLQDAPRVIALIASRHDHAEFFGNEKVASHESTGIIISSQSTVIPTTGAAQGSTAASQPTVRAIVEVVKGQELENLSLQRLTSKPIQGCMGLINVGQDLFVAVVTGSQQVGSIRPGEVVMRITSMAFYCVNRATWDETLVSDIATSQLEPYDAHGPGHDGAVTQPSVFEHPCTSLKKLLSTGTFYYAKDGSFDISTRLDQRVADAIRTGTSSARDISLYDSRFVWNNYMIEPLINFRDRLEAADRAKIDAQSFLLLAIQGYVGVVDSNNPPVSATASLVMPQASSSGTLALISRLSWKRAGTRFNTRGIDDDGNVANFVESETILSNGDVTFSFVQVRGSVPLFWEQQGLQAFNARIQVTRSRGASQPAFDRHFSDLISHYSKVHALNLLGTRDAETVLSAAYAEHIRYSSAESVAALPADDNLSSQDALDDGSERIGLTNFDFHSVSRTAGGIDGVRNELRYLGPVQLKRKAFGFTLIDATTETLLRRQKGVFRTNCLDCLDRTNVVQDMLSRGMLDTFFEAAVWRDASYDVFTAQTHPIWTGHRVLWAENGDSLSKIYAGTGALNTSYTRSGKKTLGGMLSDAAKSAGRMYINNFQDKSKQNVIDVLLGNMASQKPVTIFDPIVDSVTAALNARVDEFSSSRLVSIFSGTYNLNGKAPGETLLPWLFPDGEDQEPDIFVLGFQEIVQLTPQQILMTDPDKIRIWEAKIIETLSKRPTKKSDYILLRSEQLVGTALVVLIKEQNINDVRLVEAATRKTGLKGISGNKGGVAIRMDYFDTSLCFVTAHFAAGHAAYEERNADYWTITRGLSFARGKTVSNHDHVIWLGDFNYRIDLPNDVVRTMAARDDIAGLTARDQLTKSRDGGLVFQGYEEGSIRFLPTYKYDNGSDQYDSSEKQRIPSWTDRILFRGLGLEQLSYFRAELKTSDHRPVYAFFTGPVRIIDHLKRDTIRKQLLKESKAANGIGGTHADNNSVSSDSDADTDLPEPSGEQNPWWYSAKAKTNGSSLAHREETATDFDPFDSDTSDSEQGISGEAWTRVNPFRSTTTNAFSHEKVMLPSGRQAVNDMRAGESSDPTTASSALRTSTPPLPISKGISLSPTSERRVSSGPAALANLNKAPPPPIPLKPSAVGGARPTSFSMQPTSSSGSNPPSLPHRPALGSRSGSYSSQKSAPTLLDDSE